MISITEKFKNKLTQTQLKELRQTVLNAISSTENKLTQTQKEELTELRQTVLNAISSIENKLTQTQKEELTALGQTVLNAISSIEKSENKLEKIEESINKMQDKKTKLEEELQQQKMRQSQLQNIRQSRLVVWILEQLQAKATNNIHSLNSIKSKIKEETKTSTDVQSTILKMEQAKNQQSERIVQIMKEANCIDDYILFLNKLEGITTSEE